MGDNVLFKYIKSSNKAKDLVKIKSIEGKISLGIAFVIALIASILVNYISVDDVNKIIRELSIPLATALIGLLGFVITGLALMLGIVPNSIANQLKKYNKMDSLNGILASFQLVGMSVFISILLLIISYFVSYFIFPVNAYAVFISFLMIGYLVIFSLIYSVSLIGNCIEIFNVVSEFDSLGEVEETTIEEPVDLVKTRCYLNTFRIMALEKKYFLTHPECDIEEFQKEIKGIINAMDDGELKESIMNMYRTVYNDSE